MTIWKKPASLEQLNKLSNDCMVEHLGIEFTEIGHDYLKASMPVDKRTHQPMGLLHGGASVALAETIGSSAAVLACPDGYAGVGLEINANHMRGVRSGHVHATAKPLHIGRTTHVWAIEIVNDAGKMVCASRLTMAIIEAG
ncbi:MAG: hotdog fold thioesterase [Gammaproteobacteria bacterium]|nr:hotdog fold thioesterase [Gammaproteobacteria bacterium]NNM14103.1 hotdog fold thioesterase [Gammaproteobacteria bacterium]